MTTEYKDGVPVLPGAISITCDGETCFQNSLYAFVLCQCGREAGKFVARGIYDGISPPDEVPDLVHIPASCCEFASKGLYARMRSQPLRKTSWLQQGEAQSAIDKAIGHLLMRSPEDLPADSQRARIIDHLAALPAKYGYIEELFF